MRIFSTPYLLYFHSQLPTGARIGAGAEVLLFSSQGQRITRLDKPLKRLWPEQARLSDSSKTNRGKCHSRAGQSPRSALHSVQPSAASLLLLVPARGLALTPQAYLHRKYSPP